MRVKKKNQFDFWHSKGVFAFLLFFSFVLVFYSFDYLYKKYQKKQEISMLDSRLEELKKQNSDLLKRKKMLEDENIIEKEARLKLNFKKDGERVIVIVNEPKKNSDTKNNSKEKKLTKSKFFDAQNPKKWLEFIFLK